MLPRYFAAKVALPLALLAFAACGGDGKRVENPSSEGGAGGGSGGAASGGLGTGGGAGMTGTPCAAAPDLGVRFVGRTDGCDPTGVRYAWSGSGFVGAFRGTGINVRIKGGANQHTVLIDGEVQPKLVTKGDDAWHTLAADLPEGEHRVEMYRRTEASFGTTVVQEFEVEGGELLAPPPPVDRRLEVIGDSITCGYGNEGTLPCAFSADTENNYLAFGSVLARSLNAELSTVAWSGKGVIHNYGGDKVSPLPILYDRVDPSDRAHPWDFAFQPHVVVINLGTNDYSTAGNEPTSDVFVSVYSGFLERLRAVYPDAFILCTNGPLLSGAALATVRANIRAAVAARAAAGDTNIDVYDITTQNQAPGCDWHPSVAVQAKLAAELEVPIRARLGWQ